jgi:hypothetical protein
VLNTPAHGAVDPSLQQTAVQRHALGRDEADDPDQRRRGERGAEAAPPPLQIGDPWSTIAGKGGPVIDFGMSV